MSGSIPGRVEFTDKHYLSQHAYGAAQRLADRAAIYRHRVPIDTEHGPFPVRGGADGLVELLSSHLDPDRTGPALDVGTGRGNYLPLLADASSVVVAADISAGMLAAVPDGPWVKTVADVEQLPFPTGFFEIVLANHMLYHAPNLGLAVVELRRVLQPAGVVLALTNGDDDKLDLYEIVAEAASLATGRRCMPLRPSDRRFSLESGAVALASAFAGVTTVRTTGVVRLDTSHAIADLIRYYRSVDDTWTSAYHVTWRDLEAALLHVVHERLARGPIEIATVAGLLIATGRRASGFSGRGDG